MLLPSVALVAFGVVAVANERAAVERRLTEEYDARLRALALDLFARLDKAADAVAAGAADPLIASVQSLVPSSGAGGGGSPGVHPAHRRACLRHYGNRERAPGLCALAGGNAGGERTLLGHTTSRGWPI